MFTDCTTAVEALTGPNTESITPTTTPGAIATTNITEAPIAQGEPETSSNCDAATLMEAGYGLAVAVTNSAGKEISSPKPWKGFAGRCLFLGRCPCFERLRRELPESHCRPHRGTGR